MVSWETRTEVSNATTFAACRSPLRKAERFALGARALKLGKTLPCAGGAGIEIISAGADIASLYLGELARTGWESAVPLDIREALDSGDFGYVFK